MSRRAAIVVFAKPPVVGRVKTRLIGALTPQQAAAIHRACLEDTLSQVARVPRCERVFQVAGTTQQARRLAKRLRLSPQWRVGIQHGGDLGERLHRAFATFFRAGYGKVVVVGSDTPWMDSRRIRNALRLLDSADVVLGPTDDGGYYLVGARRVFHEMFLGISWSTSQVFKKTLAALRKARARVRLLPRDFDLDRPEDLARAARLLQRSSQQAPSLSRWLRKWRTGSLRQSRRRRAPARRNKTRRPGRA